jgi:hypothetical protein
MSIYQEIWDADQAGAGVKPILGTDQGDPAVGYVQVATVRGPGEDVKILQNVVIPPAKLRTYNLVRTLFDNYALAEPDRENETPQEREEVHDLLTAVIDTPPMEVARAYVERAAGTTVSRQRWYTTLMEHWFRRFSSGGDPDLSGFEHVFVGEQEGPKVQGYHFWYKYYLDDGLAGAIDLNRLPGFRDDRIEYLRGAHADGQERFPESVTISYRWYAPDYDRGALRPLTKPVGGFFVGCSVEGLMAMGSVRAHLGARAPKEAVINGARYDLKIFRSPDNQNIRTFYPVFLGPAADAPLTVPVVDDTARFPVASVPLSTQSGAVRILAALVNPAGDDPEKETVTLINTGSNPVSLEAWHLRSVSGKRHDLGVVSLDGGMAITVVLPRNSIQLSNKGGEILLVDRDGRLVHRVSYTKAQATEQGRTITF